MYLISGAFSLLSSLLLTLHLLLLSLLLRSRLTAGMELCLLNTNFICKGLAEGAIKDVGWSAFRAATVEQHIGSSSL